MHTVLLLQRIAELSPPSYILYTLNCIVAYNDIREIYIFIIRVNFIWFLDLSRHISSLFISSAESITLSPGIQVKVCNHPRKELMYLSWLEHFVIWFMKIKNRRGPKIDPCGTPHWISLGFESTLFIDMYYSLFVRYERNLSKAIPRTP